METSDYPAKNRIAKLIVREYHNHGHLEPEYVLSNRIIYWILKGRSIIKQVGRRCILSQRKRTKNIQPKLSDIPFARLEAMKAPLNSTGIDLFGPITIK